MLKYRLLFLIIWCGFLGFSQQDSATTSQYVNFDCQIIQTKHKLKNQVFASVEPVHLRVNNENHVYATLQFGKRKSNIFLYLQILDNNVCIRKDKVVDIFYKNGEIVTLKNDYPLNCEGYFAKELTKKEWQKLMVEEIIMFKVYTFKKNYEIFVSSVESQNINQFINCLSTYKVKEVKKEKKEKEKK